MSTHIEHDDRAGTDDRAEAVRDADTGARAWRRAVHAQQTSSPGHGDFYVLAGEVLDTLRSLDSLAGLLARQTADYPSTVTAAGGRLYDDEHAQPGHRIRAAVLALAETRHALAAAERAANRYWSTVGHIGVQHPATIVEGGEQR